MVNQELAAALCFGVHQKRGFFTSSTKQQLWYELSLQGGDHPGTSLMDPSSPEFVSQSVAGLSDQDLGYFYADWRKQNPNHLLGWFGCIG